MRGGLWALLWLSVFPAVSRSEETRIEICDALNCGHRAQVSIDARHVGELARLFTPPPVDAAAERARIASAIALLENIAGAQTPTYRDRGRNPTIDPPAVSTGQTWPPLETGRRKPDIEGELDCVAEAENAGRYLRWLDDRGWLRHHRIRERAFRTPQHWAAQVEELSSHRLYVIDSWPRDNGEPPQILPYPEWRKAEIRPLPVARK